MYEAARLHDPIAHSSALAGFLIGAAIGIALIAAVGFTVITCGAGAPLLAALITISANVVVGTLAAVAANGILAYCEAIGRSIKSEVGEVASGSSNVFINNREAARVEFSAVNCEDHPPIKRIAEGSSNVFINGKAAARKDDRTECDATVNDGSNNVFIGGGSQQYLEITPEIPDWLRKAVKIAFVVAGLVGGISSLLKGGIKGLSSIARCPLKFIASYAAGVLIGSILSRYIPDDALSAHIGHPVDMTSGRKIILPETDFLLPGRLPIECSRFYSNTLTKSGLLGPGWRLDWEVSLSRSGNELVYCSPLGRSIHFAALEPGHQVFDVAEQIYLSRAHDGRYIIHTLTRHYFVFGEFDAQDIARLALIEGPDGQHMTLEWCETGRLCEIKAHGGYWLRLHDLDVGNAKRLSHIELLAGGTPGVLVRYGYDADGYLNSVTDRTGTLTRSFAYEDGLMVRHTNAEGFECTYRWAHDADGRTSVVEHCTSTGEHYRFNYDFAAGYSEATDVFGNVAQWHFDEREQVTSHTGFDGRSYRFEYDAASGWPNVLHLPGERTVRLAYDTLGRLIEEIDPLGQRTRYDYHASTHAVRQVTLQDGRSWRTHYDEHHRAVETVDPLGRHEHLEYAEDGQLARIVDARGGTVELKHDARGLLVSRTDCSGRTSRYDYDEDGRVVTLTDALNQTTRIRYNTSGYPEALIRADMHEERYKWNALGDMIEHTDSAGYTECWARDGLGRVQCYTDAQGQTVRYERDAHGRPRRLVNGNGAHYAFEWDALGRLQRERRVDGVVRDYRYDAAGFMQYVCMRAGASERLERHERDKLGRLIERIGEHSRTSYHYDALGQLSEARRIPSEAGERLGLVADTVRFDYDVVGQLQAEHGARGSLRYEHDVLGNVTALSLPDGQRIETLYYGSGHAHQIQVNGETIADFERDGLHREVLRTQGTLKLHTHYTRMGQVAWQRASAQREGLPAEADSALWRRYRYDSRGEMVESVERTHGRTTYAYDRAGQLLMRSAESFDAECFAWDAAGNLLDAERVNEGVPPLMDNLLRRYKGTRYVHDEWGQVIERDGMRLGWDAEGQMLWTDDGVSRAWYTYDALGRRLEKRVQVSAQPERRTQFVWDGLRLVQERVETGTIRTYVYDPQRAYAPLARVDRAYANDSGKVYHYHTDPAGTAREVTDSEGRVVWSGSYAAWGHVRVNVVSSTAGGFEQPLRFAGQYADAESGLHYNTFRYYDPKCGRFVSSDPIGLAGGLNLHQYAPNPISWIDPWGLCLKLAKKIQERANAGKIPKIAPGKVSPKGFHGRLSDERILEIVKNPDGVYEASGGAKNIIFAKDGDIVVFAGDKAGAYKGQAITAYGPSGPRGDSGAAIFGGLPSDPGMPITPAMITSGSIPTPGGGNLPPATQIFGF